MAADTDTLGRSDLSAMPVEEAGVSGIITFIVDSWLGRALAGAVVMLGLWAWNNAAVVGRERARVEKEASKVDARAQPARRAAELNPHGVLKRYYRD